jgi:hypothetical protein
LIFICAECTLPFFFCVGLFCIEHSRYVHCRLRLFGCHLATPTGSTTSYLTAPVSLKNNSNWFSLGLSLSARFDRWYSPFLHAVASVNNPQRTLTGVFGLFDYRRHCIGRATTDELSPFSSSCSTRPWSTSKKYATTPSICSAPL